MYFTDVYVKQPEMDWCISSPVWKQFLLLCSLHTWKINWWEKLLKCRCQIWWMLNFTLTLCAWFWILISLLILLILHHTENVTGLMNLCSCLLLWSPSVPSVWYFYNPWSWTVSLWNNATLWKIPAKYKVKDVSWACEWPVPLVWRGTFWVVPKVQRWDWSVTDWWYCSCLKAVRCWVC